MQQLWRVGSKYFESKQDAKNFEENINQSEIIRSIHREILAELANKIKYLNFRPVQWYNVLHSKTNVHIYSISFRQDLICTIILSETEIMISNPKDIETFNLNHPNTINHVCNHLIKLYLDILESDIKEIKEEIKEIKEIIKEI